MLFILLNLGFSSSVQALDIYAIYLGNCERELGAIVNVRNQRFDLLTVNGKIKTFPRYQAIYLATYPIDLLPTSNLSTKKGVKIYSVKSLSKGSIKPFLKGWAINFTENQVSFLTVNRDEVLVDKNDIWDIREEEKIINFKSRSSGKTFNKILFVDPYPFAHCRRDSKKNKINPEKLYSSAIDIRKEFNRLQLGHEELSTFIRRKVFYPRPEIYTNQSILGLWLMPSARYGASSSRSNNFSPFLRNELSLGAYSYQHLITTGSGPILDGTHLDTQMHFYYRMKAEYLHFSFMTDPNIFLVGPSQYLWKSEDLNNLDFRSNENSFLEFGIDYGNLSIGYTPGLDLHAGVRIGNRFESTQYPLAGGNIRYTGISYMANFIFGSGGDEFSTFKFMRVNLQKKIQSKHELILSAINKSITGHLKDGGPNQFHAPYTFNSWSFSGIYKHQYKRRFYFGTLIGLESYSMEATEDLSLGSNQNTTPHKVNPIQMIFGINSALKF